MSKVIKKYDITQCALYKCRSPRTLKKRLVIKDEEYKGADSKKRKEFKKYADMINRRKLKVHKVGISFSSETRSIAEWKCS